MSDIGGPRRPLDLRTASRQATGPAGPPASRPIASRPAQAPLRPTAAPRPAAERPASIKAAQLAQPQAPVNNGGVWKTILQFIIGVVIIVLVAFSIVVLYVKYYAG